MGSFNQIIFFLQIKISHLLYETCVLDITVQVLANETIVIMHTLSLLYLSWHFYSSHCSI